METTSYSFKKGLYKAFLSVLTIMASFIAFTKFGDISIWALLEEYLKPFVGAMTVGGAITMLVNFIKTKVSLGKRSR